MRILKLWAIRCSRLIAVAAAGAFATLSAHAQSYQIASSATSYSAYNPGNGQQAYQIRIWAPMASGTFPIAIVLRGTHTNSREHSTWTNAVATGLARRGIVAAEVLYANEFVHGCGCDGRLRVTGITTSGQPYDCSQPRDGYLQKADAIFNNANPRSALRRIIAHTANQSAKASLSKGIVVAGHSQGSRIAYLAEGFVAGNGGPSVAAAFLSTAGTKSYRNENRQPDPFPIECSRHGYTNAAFSAKLVNNGRVRLIMGERDEYFAGEKPSLSGARTAAIDVTGLCPNATGDVCFTGSGRGGWRIVRDFMVTDGNADHRFYLNARTGEFDTRWLNGYAAQPANMSWTLPKLLDWLASKV